MAENEQARQAFYTRAAVEHGGMAAHYAERIVTLRDVPTDQWDLEWSLAHIISEAREAWHFALLLTEEQVAAEMASQAAQKALEDSLMIEF